MADKFQPPPNQQPIIREEVSYRSRKFVLVTQPSNLSSTGTKLWSSAYELLGWLDKNKKSLVPSLCLNKRILELGSGCGLAGLAFLSEGAAVTFTDVPEVMHLLQTNVTNNATQEERERARVLPYLWGGDDTALGTEPFDVLIGTDIVYRLGDVEPLNATLLKFGSTRTRVILAMEDRDPVVTEGLLKKLGESFEISKVKKSQMSGSEDSEFVHIYQLRRKT